MKKTCIAILICLLAGSWQGTVCASSSSEPPPRLSLGYTLWMTPLIGIGLLESSLNNGAFGTGFAYGISTEHDIARILGHRFSVGMGLIDYTNSVVKGTEVLTVETSYARGSLSIRYRHQWRFFYLGLKSGLGLTIIGSDKKLVQHSRTYYSETTGIQPGFLGSVVFGWTVGNRAADGERRFRLGVEADWNRRGRRDEFAIMLGMGFRLIQIGF